MVHFAHLSLGRGGCCFRAVYRVCCALLWRKKERARYSIAHGRQCPGLQEEKIEPEKKSFFFGSGHNPP